MAEEEEGKRNRVDQALHGCNQAAASHCISTVIIAGVKYSCSSRVSVSFGKMLRCTGFFFISGDSFYKNYGSFSDICLSIIHGVTGVLHPSLAH